MKLRTSFKGKLLLLLIVPLALAQIVTLSAVTQTVTAELDQQTTESLYVGATVVDELLASHSEQLRRNARVLAADFGLKEALTAGDRDTIVSVLDSHSQRVGADLAYIQGIDGSLIAASANLSPDRDSGIPSPGDVDANNESRVATSILNGHAYHTTTVPLRAPDTVAWVTIGFRIDDALAARLATLTGLEVELLSNAGDELQLVASSINQQGGSSALPALQLPLNPVDEVYTSRSAGSEWLTLRTTFLSGDDNVQVVLKRSVQEMLAPFVATRSALIAFSAVLLAFVALGGAWISGDIERPLRVFSEAARRMISGRYDQIDELAAGDEFDSLANSFSAMQSAIADREQRISHQAMHDPLTDLPNRNNIMQHLNGAIDRAKSASSTIAVVCIRLSSLGSIASTLGHSASDQVITLAARHLRLNLHPSQVLGHVGTSEFVLILPQCEVEEAINTADLIADILSAGVTLDRVNVALQTEVGIAMYPQHASGATEILRNAAVARSEAEARREPIVVYENGREDFYARQLRIVNDLRGALHRDEVHVHFQPKVSLPDGTPCGAEALVRWNHPELDWLSPDEFIPAAEQAGTIVHVTRFVLRRAVEECRKWHDAGHQLQVAVNLSVRDLLDEYLPHYIEQILQENEVKASQLTLEITENTVMENIQESISVLQSLRDTGVRISMDDFGTGHSSLAQLKMIPLDELKIDKSFIMTMLGDQQNQAIVKATLELAHNMNLHVVAEGVEDEETIRQLANAGCEEAQGFYLSRPIAADQLLEWLENWQPVLYAERRSTDRAFRKKA
jgi:diguanylate cyclase (GGDEF)-like protein